MDVRARRLPGFAVAVGLALIVISPGQAPRSTQGTVDRSTLTGGLRIEFTGWACTSGFTAHDPEMKRWYLLTAGHCLADSGLFARWSHAGRDVGRAAMHGFRAGSNADAGAIEISQSQANSLVSGPTGVDAVTVTGRAPDSAQSVGTRVCRSGATSGWMCGSIVAGIVDLTIRGVPIRRTWWTDFPSAMGDSGAPIIDSEGRALGILIATTSTQSVYSTIDSVAAELDLELCSAEACE